MKRELEGLLVESAKAIEKIYPTQKEALKVFPQGSSGRMMYDNIGYCLAIAPGGYQWQLSSWSLVDGEWLWEGRKL